MKKLAFLLLSLIITGCFVDPVKVTPLVDTLEIKSIKPHVIKASQKLTITGTGLNDVTEVTVGNELAGVLSRSDTSLEVLMPTLDQGTFTVTVKKGDKSDTYQNVIVLETASSRPPITGPYSHDNNPGYFPGELMISIPSDLSRASLEAALKQSGSKLKIKTFVPPVLTGMSGMCGKSLVILELPDNTSTAAVMEEFRRLHPELEGLDWWGDAHTADLGDQVDALPDDPSPSDSEDGWGWQVSGVPSGFAIAGLGLNTRLEEIKVAVLDTGVSAHQEFRINGENKAVAFAEGRDFSDEFPLLTDNYARRDQTRGKGHGTGVAAIIGALNYNKNFIGIEGITAQSQYKIYDGSMVGVSPGVQIVPVKICQKQSNDSQLAYPPVCEGIKVAAGICHAIAKQVKVINLSLGGPLSSPIIHAILKQAAEANISIITASGNTGRLEPHYPAAYSKTLPGSFERIPGLIAVGAIGLVWTGEVPTPTLTDYTTRGSWVDIVAPGGGAISKCPITTFCQTDPGIYVATSTFDGIPDVNSYDFQIGTSFAAPFVTGTAALLVAQNPNLTPEAIKAKIKLEGLEMPAGCTAQTCGAGLLDVSKSLGLNFSIGSWR
jgi:subtilisin family serine protease